MKAAILALALASGTAHARCPAESPALAAHGDEVRLAWIQARLAHTAHRATVWLRGWEIGIVTATVFNAAMIPIVGDTRGHVIDFGVGAASSVVGLIPFVFLPPRVIEDHRAVDALAAGPTDRCVVLAEAEQRLAASAAAQHQQHAWYAHVGNVAFNAGVVLVFGAFGHWGTGAVNGVAGVLIGETIIYTAPDDQIDDLARYRRGDLTPARESWQLVPAGTGIAFAYHWR